MIFRKTQQMAKFEERGVIFRQICVQEEESNRNFLCKSFTATPRKQIKFASIRILSINRTKEKVPKQKKLL